MKHQDYVHDSDLEAEFDPLDEAKMKTIVSEFKLNILKLLQVLETDRDDFYRLRILVDKIVSLTVSEVAFFEKCDIEITSCLSKAVFKLDHLRRQLEVNRDNLADLAGDTTNYLFLEMKLFKILCNVYLIELTSNRIMERKLPTFEYLAMETSTSNVAFKGELTGDENLQNISPIIPLKALFRLVLRSIIYLSNICRNWKCSDASLLDMVVDMKQSSMRQLFLFLIYFDKFSHSPYFKLCRQDIRDSLSGEILLAYKTLNQVLFNGLLEVTTNVENLSMLLCNKVSLGYLDELTKVYYIIFHDFDFTILENFKDFFDDSEETQGYTSILLNQEDMNSLFTPEEVALESLQLTAFKCNKLMITFMEFWEMIMKAFKITANDEFQIKTSLTFNGIHTIASFMSLLLQIPKSNLELLSLHVKDSIVKDVLTMTKVMLKAFMKTFRTGEPHKYSLKPSSYKDFNLILTVLSYICALSTSRHNLHLTSDRLIESAGDANSEFGDLLGLVVEFVKLHHRNTQLKEANEAAASELSNIAEFNTSVFNQKNAHNGVFSLEAENTTAALLLGIIWNCLCQDQDKFYKLVGIEIGKPFVMGQNNDSLMEFLVSSSHNMTRVNPVKPKKRRSFKRKASYSGSINSNGNENYSPLKKASSSPRSNTIDIFMLKSESRASSDSAESEDLKHYGLNEGEHGHDQFSDEVSNTSDYEENGDGDDNDDDNGDDDEYEEEDGYDDEAHGYGYESDEGGNKREKRIQEAEDILRMMTKLDFGSYGIGSVNGQRKDSDVISITALQDDLNHNEIGDEETKNGEQSTASPLTTPDDELCQLDNQPFFSSPSPNASELCNFDRTPKGISSRLDQIQLNHRNENNDGGSSGGGNAMSPMSVASDLTAEAPTPSNGSEILKDKPAGGVNDVVGNKTVSILETNSNSSMLSFKLKKNIISKLKSPFGKKDVHPQANVN